MAVGRHALQDLVAVVERRRHQLGRLVAGEAEHDALVAGAFVLVAGGVDALRDMRRLAVQMVLEAGRLPVEAFLLIADALDGVADDLLDLVAGAGRPAVRVLELLLVVDRAAADFAADDDPLRGDQRFAGDARLRVLGQEQVDDGVANLVGDLVGMAFGNRFGGEEIAAAHEPVWRSRVLDIRKSLYVGGAVAAAPAERNAGDDQQEAEQPAG